MAEDDNKTDEEKAAERAAEEAALKEAQSAMAIENEKAKKKSFRIFLVLAIVNIGFLGWLIYTMRFQVKEPREDEIESLRQEIPAEEVTNEDGSGVEALSDAIPIEPFLVNVIARHKGKARQGQKVLRVRFEVIPENEKTIIALDKSMPKIRDSVNILLSSQDYGDLAMSQGREALRSLIRNQINEVIQPDKVLKVYFIEFVIN